MRNGNPIPGLRIEQNNNNIRYQMDSQQNWINFLRQERRQIDGQANQEINGPANNIMGENNKKPKNFERSNDNTIKINIKKNKKGNEMDLC